MPKGRGSTTIRRSLCPRANGSSSSRLERSRLRAHSAHGVVAGGGLGVFARPTYILGFCRGRAQLVRRAASPGWAERPSAPIADRPRNGTEPRRSMLFFIVEPQASEVAEALRLRRPGVPD